MANDTPIPSERKSAGGLNDRRYLGYDGVWNFDPAMPPMAAALHGVISEGPWTVEDLAEAALALPEVAEWRRKAELCDRVTEIMGSLSGPFGDCMDPSAVLYGRIAPLFPEAD